MENRWIRALRGTYAKSKRVFSTHHDGAVTVEITPDGQLIVTPFLHE